MDGYRSMVLEFVNLALASITAYKAILVLMLPPNLGMSVNYIYQGLSGATVWVGYLVAALYFFALDQGWGN